MSPYITVNSLINYLESDIKGEKIYCYKIKYSEIATDNFFNVKAIFII